MKKSLIALAVAGAMTVPMIAQADALLYGSLRLKYNYADETKADDASGDKQTLGLGDNVSRIGVRGTQATGIDGVTATFRGEWKVISGGSGDFGAGRLAYVGLNTNYGNLNIGRIWTPAFLMVGSMTDILDGNGSGASHSYAPGQTGRQASMTSFTTPKMGGFQAALAVQTINDNDQAAVAATGKVSAVAAKKDDDDIDMWNLAATYEIAGVRLAATHTSNENSDNDITTVAASYTQDALYVAALYSQDDNRSKRMEDMVELAATYDLGNTKLLANYTDYDKNGSHIAVEAQYKLGKQARAFVNYIAYDSDAERLVGTAGALANSGLGASDALSFGYRVDF